MRELVSLLEQRLSANPLSDSISPVATILLALAAVVVAFFSWRTASRANSIVERHRKEDRSAKEARFRRGIAVDMREWLSSSIWRAKFGVYFSRSDDEGNDLWAQSKSIEARLEREGEENGLRLMKLLHRKLMSLDRATANMSPKDLARSRHPSRMFAEETDLLPLVKRWTADPASIGETLDADESGETERSQARAEALSRLAVKVGAGSVVDSGSPEQNEATQ